MEYADWLYTLFVATPQLLTRNAITADQFSERACTFAHLIESMLRLTFFPIPGPWIIKWPHIPPDTLQLNVDFLRPELMALLNIRSGLLTYKHITPRGETVAQPPTIDSLRTPDQFCEELWCSGAVFERLMTQVGLIEERRRQFVLNQGRRGVRFGLDDEDGGGDGGDKALREHELSLLESSRVVYALGFSLAWLLPKLRGGLLLGHSRWMDHARIDGGGELHKAPHYSFQLSNALEITELAVDYVLQRLDEKVFLMRLGWIIERFHFDSLTTADKRLRQNSTYTTL